MKLKEKMAKIAADYVVVNKYTDQYEVSDLESVYLKGFEACKQIISEKLEYNYDNSIDLRNVEVIGDEEV